ncbi:MAG: hypothetical protein VYA32_06420 [Planctomycetota bacterium]|nr:hypothetical protein [Planctomycetota bacterium]
MPTERPTGPDGAGELAKDLALQKAVQQPAVLPRTGPQSDLALSTQAPVLQRDAANCQKVPKGQAPRKEPSS